MVRWHKGGKPDDGNESNLLNIASDDGKRHTGTKQDSFEITKLFLESRISTNIDRIVVNNGGLKNFSKNQFNLFD